MLQLYGVSDHRGEDLPLTPPSWHADAACAGTDTEWFFDGEDTEGALAVCEDCAAREPCLKWALEHDEAGVWGGTTDRDRDRLRRGLPPVERTPVRTAPSGPEAPRRGLAPCGTPAAYMRHRRNGEDACEPCREANRLKSAESNRKRREDRQAA